MSNTFCESLYSMFGQDVDKCLDFIFDYIDKACWDGNFSHINDILGIVDEGKIGPDMSQGLLTISCCVKSKLPNWELFRVKCSNKWPPVEDWNYDT